MSSYAVQPRTRGYLWIPMSPAGTGPPLPVMGTRRGAGGMSPPRGYPLPSLVTFAQFGVNHIELPKVK
ncbi:hypothetical protein PIB30_018801 [Stylosanthes scabra]|uniref:Uncharacterized protein n=1 Tax=Stylosanthes scabra TaxID=79078 RepID=A0ABU6S8Q5_9FABA|nr:hypothetical protein [Stylosanthes scabra]